MMTPICRQCDNSIHSRRHMNNAHVIATAPGTVSCVPKRTVSFPSSLYWNSLNSGECFLCNQVPGKQQLKSHLRRFHDLEPPYEDQQSSISDYCPSYSIVLDNISSEDLPFFDKFMERYDSFCFYRPKRLRRHTNFSKSNGSSTTTTTTNPKARKVFSSKNEFIENHLKLLEHGSGLPEGICLLCGILFQSKQDSAQHLLKQHNIKPRFKCLSEFSSKSLLSTDKHSTELVMASLDDYKCKFCGKQLVSEWTLLRHFEESHNIHLQASSFDYWSILKRIPIK